MPVITTRSIYLLLHSNITHLSNRNFYSTQQKKVSPDNSARAICAGILRSDKARVCSNTLCIAKIAAVRPEPAQETAADIRAENYRKVPQANCPVMP
ncbi:MAG: hypothetical protein ACLTF5_05220 [Butyricicoccus sp.]